MPTPPARARPFAAILAALAALAAAGCVEPGPSGAKAVVPPAAALPAASGEPVRKEPPEYTFLSDAAVFESYAVGVAGETPLSAIAFARLVLRDDAGALFDRLLESDRWVPRLYGLSGLWFTDRARYLRVARDLATTGAKIPHLYGCIGSDIPVRDLLEPMGEGGRSRHGISPVDLFAAGSAWLRKVDPRGQDLAYWRSVVLDDERAEGERRLAASVLACSFGREGLQALLGLIPLLAADLRADAIDLRAGIVNALGRVPPWAADGTLEVVTGALDGGERSVHMAALGALEPLLLSPRSRAACHALVPRLESLLGSYRRPGGGLPTEEDEAWIGSLVSVLAGIGGPAGPVLARARGHPEPVVRNMWLRPDPWSLGPWTGETVGELERLLEHPDAAVRARVLREICFLVDPEPFPPPEAVVLEVEKRLPTIRRAIQTLEGEEREELRERIDQLPRGRPAEKG